MASLMNKGRKPKFELHLTIYDLSNFPLKQGHSTVKWSLPHSIHAEHRGRTEKITTDWLTHRATYNYSKIVPVRINIDKNNNLAECWIEFEVLHDFPAPTGIKAEKMTVGTLRINLSEYIEESEIYTRRRSVGVVGASRVVGGIDNAKEKLTHNFHSNHGIRHRRNSSQRSYGSAQNLSPEDIPGAIEEQHEQPDDPVVEEGIIRRHLMHDCKINSTIKIGILMVQIDGERNYSAPPLKSAPMFGGIAGIVGDQETYNLPAPEPTSASESALASNFGETASFSVIGSHDASELVDMYRRALAASYSCMPGELAADECIEDIFTGGDGTGSALWPSYTTSGELQYHERSPIRDTSHRRALRDDGESSNSARTSNSGSPSDEFPNSATLRPSEASHRSRARSHMRNHSAGSDKSSLTVTNIWGRNGGEMGAGFPGIPTGSYGHSSRHGRGGVGGPGGTANRYPTSIPSAPTRGVGFPGDGMGFQDAILQQQKEQQHNQMNHINNGGGGPQNENGRPQSHHDIVEGQHESILRSVGLRDRRGGGHNLHDDRGQRVGSLGSLLTQGSGKSGGNGHGRHRSREWSEEVIREDLVAWKLPGAVK